MRDQRKDTETSNLTYGGITKFRDILSHLWIAQSPIVSEMFICVYYVFIMCLCVFIMC